MRKPMSERIDDDGNIFMNIPARTEKETGHYRLLKKPNGEIVFQRFYLWTDGNTSGNYWKDIQNIDWRNKNA
jgi:hypothetical protein